MTKKSFVHRSLRCRRGWRGRESVEKKRKHLKISKLNDKPASPGRRAYVLNICFSEIYIFQQICLKDEAGHKNVTLNEQSDILYIKKVKPLTYTAGGFYLSGLMSSLTGLIMFSGERIVSRSSFERIPCSSTRSYTLFPVAIASLAILVEFL